MTKESAIKILKNGGVGVLLTDTIYGIVGRALDKDVVEKIYEMKRRDERKPFIILISAIKDLKLFEISIDGQMEKALKDFWPGPTSVILECLFKEFEYLHRGSNSLAFRMPKKKQLIDIIKKTGPLVAPSANPEGLPPANNIEEAQNYFSDNADFYLMGGKPKNKPSAIIKLTGNSIEILRK